MCSAASKWPVSRWHAMAAHAILKLLYSPHLVLCPSPQFDSGIGKAGKGRGAKGGKGGNNAGKSGKGKAGKLSSKPTPKPGPGTPPGTQSPGSPPPTQTPGSPPPTQTPGTPPPTQSPVTSPPTQSPGTPPPTQSPVTSPPTQSPSDTETCSGLTEDMFQVMAPNAKQPYSYTGFCNAVASWNENQSTKDVKIFEGEKKIVELAAFFGHVLHESAALTAVREITVCGDFATVNDKGFCKPVGYTGGEYSADYCDPTKGCPCNSKVSESGEKPGFIESNKMFYGRGPIQLSWSYNYKDLQDKGYLPQGVDVCANPDVIATNAEYTWISVFYFWATNKVAEVVVPEQGEGDWGSALQIINSRECKADAPKGPLQQRLNYYCLAATALKAKPLLKLDGCEGLKAVYDACLKDGKCPECEKLAQQQ
jgi:hypothetical protein